MATTLEVFDQHHVARAEAPALAVGGLDLDGSLEMHDELAARRVVGHRIGSCADHVAHDHRRQRDRLGDDHRALHLPGHNDVLEVALAGLVRVQAGVGEAGRVAHGAPL